MDPSQDYQQRLILAILLNVSLDQIPQSVLQHLAHPPPPVPPPVPPPYLMIPPVSPISFSSTSSTPVLDDSPPMLLQSISDENKEEKDQDAKEEDDEEVDAEDDTDDEDEPPSKRFKSMKDVFYLKLRSGHTFYFRHSDGEDLLLPHRVESNPFVRKWVASVPVPLKERLTYLAYFTPHADMNQSDALNEIVDSHPPANITHLRSQFFSAFLKEIRLRNAFRKVVQRWRVYQMEKRYTPTVDPITLEMPTKPVEVYDWPNKTKYVFDARSLSVYLDSKLQYNEGGFAVPIYPRNPWTNAEFTYAQLVSIFQQLQAHGELRVVFHSYRHANFNPTHWHRYYHSPLTMHAIQTSLVSLDTVDARELLEDFIVAMLEQLGYNVTDTMLSAYRIAMKHLPQHWFLQECKRLALMHYESTHFRLNRDRRIREACAKVFPRQVALFQDLVEKKLIYRLPCLVSSIPQPVHPS